MAIASASCIDLMRFRNSGLVLLFFVVLTYKNKVLYAPSDFVNEQLFVDLLQNNQKVQKEIDNTNRILRETSEILEEKQKSNISGGDSSANYTEILNAIERAQTNLNKARETSSYSEILNYAGKVMIYDKEEYVIVSLLEKEPGLSSVEIKNRSGYSRSKTNKMLKDLISKGYVKRENEKYYMDY